MSTPTKPGGPPAAAVVLMSVTSLWSGALALAFGWSAAAGGEKMTFGRTLMFWVIAGFLGVLSVRTGYELARRLLRRS